MMSRIILVLLVLCSLSMTFGCATKKAQTPTPASTPPPQETSVTTPTPNDSLRAEQKLVREETIAAEPSPPPRNEPARSEELNPASLQTVLFSYDQHLLSDEARNIIAANAAILKGTKKSVKFELAGHCDERGSDQYNIALGERRAESVRAYLIELGIDAGRMETVSYGEERPVDAGHDENAWMKNRRVEFVLLP